MSNPLKNKTFSTVIKIAAVGLMAYGIGSAVMAASAAGTAGAGAAGASSMAGGMDAAVNAGISANAVGGGGAVVAKTAPDVMKQMVTENLGQEVGKKATGGFLSSMMENPMVQYGLVQTGGAMLQGAMTPEAEGNTNDYNVSNYAPTNSYAPNTSDREKPAGSTMPTYNQETKRWES